MPAKKANSKIYNAYATGGARNAKNLAQNQRAAVPSKPSASATPTSKNPFRAAANAMVPKSTRTTSRAASKPASRKSR